MLKDQPLHHALKPKNNNEKDLPEELKKKLEEVINPDCIVQEKKEIPKKKGPGRPKGIPASDLQKASVSRAAKEYQRKIKDGLIEKPNSSTHGAYAFMTKGRIPRNKRHLLDFVNEERKKWIDQLGGVDNLSYIELSLLDEACRLLLYCTMINDYLLRDKNNDIVYKDADSGEIKMHSALSRNYLSFTKTYITILKELTKMSKGGKKRGGGDAASKLQGLYNK